VFEPALRKNLAIEQAKKTLETTVMLNLQISEQRVKRDIHGRDLYCAKTADKTNKEEGVHDLLCGFQSHGLADLDKANLMNRVDVKFILPRSFLPLILAQLEKYYSVLEINGKRISQYYNEYFDTQDMRFYQDHHNGKLNRFKVRQRTYLDTDTSFLEVKFKNNQRRTIKSRINCSSVAINNRACNAFVYQQLGKNLNELVMSHQSGYQRVALANEARAERLTLDFNLWYQLDDCDKKLTLPGFFIAELKQDKRCKRSPFFQLMSKYNIFPASFSKYCIGCALLYGDAIKTNQFKAILGQIEKFSLLENDTHSRSN
jgi:hypothetical protein